MQRIKKYLTCPCCGKYTEGRQYWNQDTGTCLCKDCGDWMLDRGDSIEDIEFSYGRRGYHWDPQPDKILKGLNEAGKHFLGASS